MVIVNWNTAELLGQCLRSLFRNRVEGGFEVIVVDNFSSDHSVELVRNEFPDVILKACDVNFGYARGNNIGIELAKGEFILTLNSDTELEPDVLQRAVLKLESMPAYGAMGVKQIGVDGNVQQSVRGFPTLRGIFGDVSGLGKKYAWLDGYRLNRFDYQKSQDAPQPMGTFLLFRREDLNKLQTPALGTQIDQRKLRTDFFGISTAFPFDTRFPIFFNEVDLLYRLHQLGVKCWYEAGISIKHFGGESTKQVRKNMIWESHLSLFRYLNKHTHGLARFSLPFIYGIIWLGALVRAKGVHAGFQP